MLRKPGGLLMALGLVLAASPAWLGAQAAIGPPFRVRDLRISQIHGSSSPRGLVVLGERAWFLAHDGAHGRELWTTDGTAEGTRRVRDARPGPASASPQISSSIVLLAAGEDRLWLVLSDGASGEELWQSDGTAGGTSLVRDLTPGPGSTSFQGGLFPWRDRVLFGRHEDELGVEPWLSDGTPEGTRRLKDVCPGECSSAPTSYAALGAWVLFEASDEEHGRELWRTDGTEPGTVLVKDLCPGTCTGVADVSPLVPFGGEVFFMVPSPASVALWKSDGTGPGTVRVKDVCVGLCGGMNQLLPRGDELYLVTDSGRQIWRSDGTAAGTLGVHRFPVELYVTSDLVAVGQKLLFFTARRGTGTNQLWQTDGTDAGTELLAELENVAPFAAPVGDRMVFPAGTWPQLALWVTDGTAAGTHPLRDVHPGVSGFPVEFAALGPATVLFAAESEGDAELWITDGTFDGTRRLKDVYAPDRSSHPTELTAFGDRVYFTATADDDRPGLVASDGTAAGTAVVVADLEVRELVAAEDRLFFVGTAGEAVMKPWRSDGTAAGTYQLSELTTEYSFAYELVTVGDTLFFAEGGEDPGQRLWKSDGTTQRTVPVRDFHPAWVSGCPLLCPGCCRYWIDYPHSLTPAGEMLFLVANDPERGAELWRTDATGIGEVVRDLAPGPDSSFPEELTMAGEYLYFTAVADPDAGRRLWRSDGTEAGTVEIPSPAPAGPPRELTARGDELFFLVASDGAGDLLYRTAGTVAEEVKPLSVAGAPGYASRLTAVGDRLFLAVFTEPTGQELWYSDGTSDGTVLVREIGPGRHGASPQSFAAVAGGLLFAADDGMTGLEPWWSDGTAAGTFPVADLAPGPSASSPAEFVVAGEHLFFAAADGRADRELWAAAMGADCSYQLSPFSEGFPAPGGQGTVVVTSPPGCPWTATSPVDWVTITAGAAGQGAGIVTFTVASNPGPARSATLTIAGHPVEVLQAAGGGLLRAGRFAVTVTWKNQHAGGTTGTGQPINFSDETVLFWFFSPSNVELIVKVLDGRPINGHFWVFYGGLSDVEYWITVTDTQSGAGRTYYNPPGEIGGNGDTSAF